MIIEKSIDKIRKYIIENTVLIEDDRKEVENSKKIKYDKEIVLYINNIMIGVSKGYFAKNICTISLK